LLLIFEYADVGFLSLLLPAAIKVSSTLVCFLFEQFAYMQLPQVIVNL
jgi:hypothetical protein